MIESKNVPEFVERDAVKIVGGSWARALKRATVRIPGNGVVEENVGLGEESALAGDVEGYRQHASRPGIAIDCVGKQNFVRTVLAGRVSRRRGDELDRVDILVPDIERIACRCIPGSAAIFERHSRMVELQVHLDL